MKRSGRLTRRKGLKPGGPLKRTRLKRESQDHRDQYKRIKVDGERDKYRNQVCQLCERTRARGIHEIAFRSKSGDSIELRCTWLALCAKCHRRMHDPSDFPIERQYALKREVDRGFYDRRKLNILRGRQPEAITEAEVDEWDRIAWREHGRTLSGVSEHGVLQVGRAENGAGSRASIGRRAQQPVRNVAGDRPVKRRDTESSPRHRNRNHAKGAPNAMSEVIPLTDLDRLRILVADRERRLFLADGGPAHLVERYERELEEAQRALAAELAAKRKEA